ncbi:MAG TPA: CHAT domain-containing protein [Terriglobia bacterium]|nr:CHAT domain-containing protein [Terriglobia bacterium]
MKTRWKWAVLGAIGGVALAAGFAVAWVLWGPFSFQSAAAKVKEEAFLLNGRDPQRMLAEANRFYWGHNLPLALPLYERAEALFTNAHDVRDALYAEIGVMRTGDETSFPEISAFIASQLQTPIVQHDPFLRLWCLGVKGDADQETNVAAAERDWNQVKTLATRLGQKEWANRATGELGIVAYLHGDYKQAAALMKAALVTAALEWDDGTEVRYLELIGNGMNGLNRHAEAMIFLDRAIRIARHDGYVGTPFMAYEGKAEALAATGHQEQAKTLMKRTLAQIRHEKMWEHEGQDLLILGEMAADSGDSATARINLNAAVESAKRMGLYRVVAQSYLDLAALSQKTGDLPDAANETEQGVRYFSMVGDTIYLPRSLDALAALKAETGQVDEAHRLYAQAEGVIDELLRRVPGAYTESSLLSEMSDTYLGDFKLAADQNDPAMAFDTIERARGRTVADTLVSRAVDPPAKNSNGAVTDEIADLQSRILKAKDGKATARLTEELVEDERELGYINDGLDPDQRNVTTHPVAFSTAQRTLLPSEAVLEYVLADPASFCLAFNQNASQIVKLPAGRAEIAALIKTYLAGIAEGKTDEQDARKLFSLLVAPVPTSLRPERLIVVPDGALDDLPFEALQDSSGHYLLQSDIISYAPSVTVLCYLRGRRPVREPQLAFLGVGAVPYDYEAKPAGRHGRLMHFLARGVYDLSGKHLYDLPSTQRELTDADAALGHPRQTVLLTGTEATAAGFEAEPLANFKIIHFAVHGLARPDFPERSALVLGRVPHSNKNGLLEVRDIARLSLDADLVTLSSCNTGTGKLEGEEGIAGLVPAFLFAGARSVVGSLWEVDDSSTGIQMKQFYTHLAQGEDEAAALRQAKLDYLRMMGDRAPIYWAGFVLVGDGSASIRF